MAIRVLVDTNVLLDYLLERIPYEADAKNIIMACQQKKITGCIAAHSITNIFYILRKNFSMEERRKILLNICKLFEIEGIDLIKLQNALTNVDFTDFEDCLQMECAINFHADYIVTRNTVDFSKSTIPCMEPHELCERLKRS